MFQADHMININGQNVIFEYEGPYHFIKDKYFMTSEYDLAFTEAEKRE